MIPIIYEATETSFTSNGLGRIPDVLSFKVTEERNGIFEADFTMPVDGANFDLLQPGRIVLVTHDDTGDTQPFDIVSYSRPIDGIVTFHATHVSYRQKWFAQSMTNIGSLSDAFADLNNNLLNPFRYVADFNAQGYMGASDGVPRSVRQLLGGMEGSILDTYGGEFEWDMWKVNLHKRRGVDRDFSIRYGVNLSEYNEEADFSSTYTSAVPIWVGQDGTVVRGRVDSGLTPYNGRVQTAVLDLTDKFETKPTTAQLNSKALTLMRSRQTNLPSQSIQINFVRLQDSAEYADFAGLFQCNLCDTIGVIFPRYGMEGRYKIVKVVWDVLAERYTEMELGTLSTSLSEALGITGETPIPTVSEDLNVAGDLTVGGTITSGGKVTSGGRIVLPYNTYFVAKDANSNERPMFFFYNNNEYFGNNSFPTAIRGSSISLSNPLSAFYKVTTVTVSVPALSAHANVAASNHSMTAQSGFNAVGIVGWSSGSYRIRPTTHYIASNTNLYAGFANTSAGATSQAFDVVFYVLWLKATSA